MNKQFYVVYQPSDDGEITMECIVEEKDVDAFIEKKIVELEKEFEEIEEDPHFDVWFGEREVHLHEKNIFIFQAYKTKGIAYSFRKEASRIIEKINIWQPES
jgi:hypothetical protein